MQSKASHYENGTGVIGGSYYGNRIMQLKGPIEEIGLVVDGLQIQLRCQLVFWVLKLKPFRY